MANKKKNSVRQRISRALGLDIQPGLKSKAAKERDQRGSTPNDTDFLRQFMDSWTKKKNIPYDRLSLYRTYDDLDILSPEIGSYLDTAASEATQLNEERNHKVWVTARKSKVRDRIEDLLYRRLKVDDWTTPTCRCMAKYGDDFGEVLFNDEGVQSIYWGLALANILRIETMDGVLQGFAFRDKIEGAWGSLGGVPGQEIKLDKIKKDISNPWDYVHFRIMQDKRVSSLTPMPNLYGTSMIRRAIRPAYRLDSLFDLLLVYRASRAIDRFILKVDVTGQIPEEQYETLQKWRSWLYEMSYTNQETGEFSALGNPLAVGEDIIWPTTRDSASDIETLQGNPNLYEAFDIDLAVNQLFGALQAPKGIFGYDDNVDLNKPYASQDIRFAKTVFKLQSSYMQGLRWIILTDLAIVQNELKLTDEELMDPDLFTLHMVPPSAILHLHRIEAMRDVLDATRDFLDLMRELTLPEDVKVEWEAHVLRSVLGTTDFDIDYFAEVLEKQAKKLKKQIKDEEALAAEGEEIPVDAGAEEEPVEGEEVEEPVEDEEPVESRTQEPIDSLYENTEFTREQFPQGEIPDKSGSDRVVLEEFEPTPDEEENEIDRDETDS